MDASIKKLQSDFAEKSEFINFQEIPDQGKKVTAPEINEFCKSHIRESILNAGGRGF